MPRLIEKFRLLNLHWKKYGTQPYENPFPIYSQSIIYREDYYSEISSAQPLAWDPVQELPVTKYKNVCNPDVEGPFAELPPVFF